MLVITSVAVIPCLAADHITSAKDLTYIIEQAPPLNFQEDGKLQGISVDLVEKIWERMGVDLNRSIIKIMPWTEGYQMTLKENNTVLFATGRIPEREQLFKWAGPLWSNKHLLLSRNDRNIIIKAPDDLKKIKIGTLKDSLLTQLLQDQGVKKEDLVLAATRMSLLEMLKNGTIDAWASGEIVGIWLLNQSGANASDYKVAYVIGQSDDYYAFNNRTSDSIVQSFQQALDYLKSNKDANGISDYDKIVSKYVPSTS
ncbi:MAG: substrate-binding periplasmic protein [Methanothrix sp.]